MLRATLFLLITVPFAHSQISAGNDSVCDRYSNSLSVSNSTQAQIQWITQFVVNAFFGNSSVIGGTRVSGILTHGTYNGTQIDLIKYFNGSLNSTNANGSAQAINLLDDGGTQALENGMLSNTQNSSQYMIFHHFSTLFARAMGCSIIGASDATAFLGKANLYEVHKFMAIDPFELGYFIEQIGDAAKYSGLTDPEANNLTDFLSAGVGYRCQPREAFFPGGMPETQSICTEKSCPLSPESDCSIYDFDEGTSSQPVPYPPPPPSNHKTVAIAAGVAVPLGFIALVGLIYWFIHQRRRIKALETRLSYIEGEATPIPSVPSDKPGSKHPGSPPIASELDFGTQQHGRSPTIEVSAVPIEGNLTCQPSEVPLTLSPNSPHSSSVGGSDAQHLSALHEME